MMQPFTILTAVAAPLPRANINTDDIFPGPSASPIFRNNNKVGSLSDPAFLGQNAFAALRWNDDGSAKPEFILNQSPYDSAKILVAGENFGCGSSREHAVWCLDKIGIRCVIAPSFGDIFYNNCFKNGLLPVRLPAAAVARLLSAVQGDQPEVTVDLDAQEVRGGGAVFSFEVDAYRRHCLLNGLDEIAATLEKLPLIEGFEQGYFRRRPWLR